MFPKIDKIELPCVDEIRLRAVTNYFDDSPYNDKNTLELSSELKVDIEWHLWTSPLEGTWCHRWQKLAPWSSSLIFKHDTKRHLFDRYFTANNEITWIQELSSTISTLTADVDVDADANADIEEKCRNILEVENWCPHKNFLSDYQFFTWKSLSSFNADQLWLQLFHTTSILSPLLYILGPIIYVIISSLHLVTPFTFNIPLSSSPSFTSSMVSMITIFSDIVRRCFEEYDHYLQIVKIAKHIPMLQQYIKMLIDRASFFCNFSSNYPCCHRWTKLIQNSAKTMSKSVLHRLSRLTHQLNQLSTSSTPSAVGSIYCEWYEMRTNVHFIDSLTILQCNHAFLLYANLIGDMVQRGTLASFQIQVNNRDNAVMTDFHYPFLRERHGKSVPQQVTLTAPQELHLLTGVNASGKTTYLKSMLMNAILAQQWGACYCTSYIGPIFHHFTSYINVCDSSERESLFQREVLRSKLILSTLEKYPTDRHFIVMDEVFTGTNYQDALDVSMNFFRKCFAYSDAVVYMWVSTHVHDLCDLSEKEFPQATKCWKTTCDSNSNLSPTYNIVEGICQIRGTAQIIFDSYCP